MASTGGGALAVRALASVKQSNPKGERRCIVKKMMAILFLSVALSAQALPQFLRELQEEGTVMAVAPCNYRGTLMMCILMEHRGDMYALVGQPNNDGVNVLYVLKETPAGPKEVWRYTDREA